MRPLQVFLGSAFALALGILVGVSPVLAQADPPSRWRPHRVGLHYNQARHPGFPFDNPNYAYATRGLKAQAAWVVRDRRRLDLELLLEPSAYAAEHRLLRFGFIQPWDTPRYEEERARFLAGRRFTEIAVNIGLLARVRLRGGWSAYGLGSVGPMVATRSTERLPRGFAFSDVAGLGVTYRRGRGYADVRAIVRHTSNAQLRTPNHGHNGAGWEAGFGWWLRGGRR